MPKIYIEKPKKPACLQIQNILLVIVSIAVFSFLEPLFLFIFITAMVVFYVYDIYNYKHMPIAILYRDDKALYYYKKGLTKIKLEELLKAEYKLDNKSNKYIQITYQYDEFQKDLTIKTEKAKEIEEDLNKVINKQQKKLTKKNKTEEK